MGGYYLDVPTNRSRLLYHILPVLPSMGVHSAKPPTDNLNAGPHYAKLAPMLNR